MQPAGAEDPRCVRQIGVDLREHGEDGQHHQRHLHLRQHHDHARFGVEQAQRLPSKPERERDLVEHALAAEDHDPCERAHHYAGENRQDDEEDEHALPARARARANPRNRIAEDEADQCRLHAEKERVPQDRIVEAIGEELEIVRGGPCRHRCVGIERERDQHDERRHEERNKQRRQRQQQRSWRGCHRCPLGHDGRHTRELRQLL